MLVSVDNKIARCEILKLLKGRAGVNAVNIESLHSASVHKTINF